MKKPQALPGLLMWGGSLDGPLAIPGDYKVELVVAGKTQSENFTIVKDPARPPRQTSLSRSWLSASRFAIGY